MIFQQMAINEASGLSVSEGKLVEKNYYVYRAHTAMGDYSEVLDEVKMTDDVPAPYRACACLASFLEGSDKETAKSQMNALLASPAGSSPSVQVAAALLYAHDFDFPKALELIKDGKTEEQ